MAIVYDPKKMLKKLAPEKRIKRSLKGDVSLKRSALSFVDGIDFIDKKAVSEVALKTVKGYQERIAKAQVAAGFEKSAGDEVADAILADPKQLIQRVQNELLFQISEKIKTQYKGERYEWLPSDADEPDPEHQLNYGKIFVVGENDYEGREFGTDGCKCGMRILVKETELKLD